jgi:hypothetical protein
VLVALGYLSVSSWPWSAQAEPIASSPGAYQSPWWVQSLGTDSALAPSDVALLNNQSRSDLQAGAYSSVRTLAQRGAVAALTGSGRSQFGTYFSAQAGGLCRNVHVLAVSPVILPVATLSGVNTTNWSKILVVYTAHCTGSSLGTSYQVLFLYAHLVASWQLTHEYQIPGSQNASPASAIGPARWQMTQFSSCEHSSALDVIVVVKAFDLMCSAAAAGGVHLYVSAGYRTRAQQAALFARAVAAYGSVERAKKYVAFADNRTCSSLHCSGIAVDVVASPRALSWLYRVVGCLVSGRVTLGPSHCTSGSPIYQMERYGFGGPAAQVPTYLAYVLPTTSSTQSCNPGAASPVPVLVAQIWRCVLYEHHVSSAVSSDVVAQAEVVSLCESGWNRSAVAFGGKYLRLADPLTGSPVTNQGIFMLSYGEMRAYGPPGALASDAVANIRAAAELWATSSSFESFGCATGHGVFDSGPVLPAYGGPNVPAWAYAY